MHISAFDGNGIAAADRTGIRGLAFKIAAARVKSAHLPNFGPKFDLLGEQCAYFCRIEYLLPRVSQA